MTEEKTQKNEFVDMVTETNSEYFAWHKQQREKPASEKAKNLNLFKLVYWAVTGSKEIPENMRKRVIEMQTDFLEKNPKRVYCDMHIFKNLTKSVVQNSNPEASNRFRKSAMDIVERSLAEDLYVAKRA